MCTLSHVAAQWHIILVRLASHGLLLISRSQTRLVACLPTVASLFCHLSRTLLPTFLLPHHQQYTMEQTIENAMKRMRDQVQQIMREQQQQQATGGRERGVSDRDTHC